MKRFIIILGVLLIFAASASAQMDCGMMGGQKNDSDRMGMMQMMPMMQRCQQMMMGHGMQMQEMMHMMMDMMKMQRKMMRGMSPADRKEMMKEMDRMQDRMEKMMSEMRGMMRGGMMMHMMPTEPKDGEQKAPLKETPKAEPHKH